MALFALGLCRCSPLAEVKTAYNLDHPPGRPAPPHCPVTLQLTNTKDEQTRMISEEACLALDGDSLAIPSDIRLWVNDDKVAHDEYRVCRKGTVHQASVEGVKTCQWNGVFRDSWPWTITLRARPPADALTSYVRGARIFRNGELIWTWVPLPHSRVQSVSVAGSELTGHLMPEGAPIDFRIVPAGVEVDAAVLAARVEERPPQWKTQLRLATDALISSPSFANGKLNEQLACVRYRAELTAWNAAELSGATRPKPSPPGQSCEVFEAEVPPSIRSRYEALKTHGAAKLGEVDRDIVTEIETYRQKLSADEAAKLEKLETDARDFWAGKGAWWAELQKQTQASDDAARQHYLELDADPKERPKLRAGKLDEATRNKYKPPLPQPTQAEIVWLETRGTLADLDQTLARADALSTAGLKTIDDVLALHAELKRDAVRIANSPDEQARLYFRVAQNLQGSSVFDQFRDNPEPVPGERVLHMRYSDTFQVYFVAPWTAFPMSVHGDADFSAANLVPIVDLSGLRWQPAPSRYADVRLGLGVSALSFTTKKQVPDETAPGGTTEVEEPQFRFAPEANVGVANFKFGFAIAMGKGLGNERYRFLIGADLYKLISGSNLELASE